MILFGKPGDYGEYSLNNMTAVKVKNALDEAISHGGTKLDIRLGDFGNNTTMVNVLNDQEEIIATIVGEEAVVISTICIISSAKKDGCLQVEIDKFIKCWKTK